VIHVWDTWKIWIESSHLLQYTFRHHFPLVSHNPLPFMSSYPPLLCFIPWITPTTSIQNNFPVMPINVLPDTRIGITCSLSITKEGMEWCGNARLQKAVRTFIDTAWFSVSWIRLWFSWIRLWFSWTRLWFIWCR
jgi:hypothetical protein